MVEMDANSETERGEHKHGVHTRQNLIQTTTAIEPCTTSRPLGDLTSGDDVDHFPGYGTSPGGPRRNRRCGNHTASPQPVGVETNWERGARKDAARAKAAARVMSCRSRRGES